MANLPPNFSLAVMPDFEAQLFAGNEKVQNPLIDIVNITVNMKHNDRIRIPMTPKYTTGYYTNSTNTCATSTSTTSNTYRTQTLKEYYANGLTDHIYDKEINRDDIIRAIKSGLLDLEVSGNLKIQRGSNIKLPDGSVLEVKNDGNFEVNDSNAKVTYKGNNKREFNKFINASDLLEDFIKDAGKVGIKQNQFFDIQIEIFINWLIYKAAEHDNDPIPTEVKLLEQDAKHLKHPHCKFCGRFVSTKLPAQFCNGDHYQRYITNEKL